MQQAKSRIGRTASHVAEIINLLEAGPKTVRDLCVGLGHAEIVQHLATLRRGHLVRIHHGQQRRVRVPDHRAGRRHVDLRAHRDEHLLHLPVVRPHLGVRVRLHAHIHACRRCIPADRLDVCRTATRSQQPSGDLPQFFRLAFPIAAV